MRAGTRRRLAVAGLLAPAVVLLLVFFVIPSADLFRLSLAHMDAQRSIHHDVSLVNYRNFATNPYFHRMVWGSVKLAAAVTVLCLLLGYPAAYYMVRVRSATYRRILYAIVVSPLLISVIVRSYGWVVLLANNGVVNGTLLSLGLIERPLRMLGTFGSVIVATVHVLLPFMMLPIDPSRCGNRDPVVIVIISDLRRYRHGCYYSYSGFSDEEELWTRITTMRTWSI